MLQAIAWKIANSELSKRSTKEDKSEEVDKNSQISLFYEIISVLPLFEKYLAIYHFLKLEFYNLEFDIKLEFTKIEYLKKAHLKLEFTELEFLVI